MDDDFLTIKLSHLGDIPKVFYKGEEITKRVKVSFIWNSKNDKEYGGCNIHIEHFERLETAEVIGRRIINHRTGSFLMGDDDNSKSN